jgi:hypothetical protein
MNTHRDDDDPGNRDLRNLLAIAEAFRLRTAKAGEILQRVAAAVRMWDDVAASFALPADERAAIQDAFNSPQLEWALSL